MASTDSTIPDASTGDSTGTQAGQSFTEKAKSAVKGNIPTVSDVKPEGTATQSGGDASTAGNESRTGMEQNTLL